MMVMWPSTKYTIGGRWWLSPSPGHGEYYESVFVHGLSVHQKCSNYALTNLLFSLCRFKQVIELLINLPNFDPRTPTRLSTPKVLQARECAPTSSSSIVLTFGIIVESIKELGGALGIVGYKSED